MGLLVLLLLVGVMADLSRSLPKGPLIIGYANWGQCDDSIIQRVREGANVVIWFSINLIKDPSTGNATVQGGPDYHKVAEIISKLHQENLTAAHLIAIGGWNSPHVDTSFSAQEWWDTWDTWNKKIANPHLGFLGFDGFDWDLEGNDNPKSSINHFTAKELNLMGELSQIAKKNSYIISMAPSQSYIDVQTSEFSLSLLHDPEWKKGFNYHGRNTYTYLLAKYGHTQTQESAPTFDFVSIQLYEGWSRANYEIGIEKVPITTYLDKLIQDMSQGWKVQFSSEPELHFSDQTVSVPPTQLVIGLANGWAGPTPGEDKFLLIWPSQINYQELTLKPRGFMFWNLQDEGKVVNGKEFWMIKELVNMYANQFDKKDL